MTSSKQKKEELQRVKNDVPYPLKEEVACDRCGHSMFRMRAVYWCERCGYKTDCCGH